MAVSSAVLPDAIIEADNLRMSFSGFNAVDGVSLRVRRGMVHALIGPNGAGKTTCFNLISKFLTPTSGTIRFNGRDITAMKTADVARLGLVRSFQISAVFLKQTALENVRSALQRRRHGDCFDFWRSDRCLSALNDEAAGLLDRVGILAFHATPAEQLSYGRKRALEIATTLALDPQMLLLDEPMAGMSSEDIHKITDVIRQVAENRTILMVEHNLSVVASLSQVITVLAAGRVLAEGDYDAVSSDDRVREAYLGSGHA